MVGCALLSELRDWARESPISAAPGIVRFTVNVIPDREHPNTADTQEAMCDEHLALAHTVHCAPGAHRIQPVGTAVGAIVDSVRSVRWTCCAGDDG
ncbi:hypothetical protein ACG93S_11245 [Streptomyces sp. WAC01490]|uniref:hypothetical protein n=1 Tax=unclassified Streptomyces TaxID=2593676 RepID=UPI003F378EC7